MSKTITIPYNGTEYTLEFNRESVKLLERAGFDINLIRPQPMTMLPMLFEGAFHMHHRRVEKDVIRKIFDKIKGKDELMNALLELYNEPVKALFDEPEDDEGNVTWGKNF
jgi:hypothetical protein